MRKKIVLIGIFYLLFNFLIPSVSLAQLPACTCTCVDSIQECIDRGGLLTAVMQCNPTTEYCCCSNSGGPLPFSFPNPLGTEFMGEIANEVINYIFRFSLVIYPLIVIWSAFMFATAAGNAERVNKARKIITFATIGFFIILLAKGIASAIGSIFNI